MIITQSDKPKIRKPLRLWPGIVIVIAQWLVRFVVPIVVPGTGGVAILGGLGGGLALIVWWLFFSRAPWTERLGVIVLMVIAVLVTSRFVDGSIANGMMGMMLPISSIPFLSLALVASAVVSRGLSNGLRRISMAAAIILACAMFTLVRTGGIDGDADSDLHWRWSQSPEERLLAHAAEQLALPSSLPATTTDANWPGFRGIERDGIVRGVGIETNWSASPPIELWRRPIGPGWSSFAVGGNFLYTQEQRGDDEVVACYDAISGKPVWMHRDATRFWESNAGAGPRATPTLSDGRIYTFGATGIVNALDAASGAVVWSRNAASDTGAKVPGWGFSSSPLVMDKMVIIATSGALVAYDLASGDLRWSRPSRGGSYSSPHGLTLDGVSQVLLMNGAGVSSIMPADGKLLWEHGWPGVPIVQPAVIPGGDLLITTADAMGGIGIRRIEVAHDAAGWTVEERWTSKALKPYFNDFVIHKGHAFGFDGAILACIDLEAGKRKWKGGRYGNGQLVLLPDQDLLLVLSEDGELALVSATPDKFTELARFPAIEGKTWNHPVLVGDVLLVRNSQEMVAFRLSPQVR